MDSRSAHQMGLYQLTQAMALLAITEDGGSIEDQSLPSDVPTFELGPPHAGAHSLDDQAALELGDGTDDDHDRPAQGLKTRFPTKTSAMKQVAAMCLDVGNDSLAPITSHTVAELIDHYGEIELSETSGKTARTIAVYRQQIRQYILPRWGSNPIGQVKTVAVEAWLKTHWGTRNEMQDAGRHEQFVSARAKV
jgi:hypothetical protein